MRYYANQAISAAESAKAREREMRFQGKNVLITGAASGIGRATAILFAEEGARVTIGDMNGAGLEETATMMITAPQIKT